MRSQRLEIRSCAFTLATAHMVTAGRVLGGLSRGLEAHHDVSDDRREPIGASHDHRFIIRWAFCSLPMTRILAIPCVLVSSSAA